jgi:uncharacterized metal-binding protein/predicted Fe-Mo cluster-binding NifX family protein
MRYAIPLLNDRVAPRCTFADSILLVTMKRRHVVERSSVPTEGTTWADLGRALTDERVDTMICGGISGPTWESLQARDVRVIENVAGTVDEIVSALELGELRSGYGLSQRGGSPAPTATAVDAGNGRIDCLMCGDRVCLRGGRCPALSGLQAPRLSANDEAMLGSAIDVAFEDERKLCRLAELVYFALDMNYRRIGLAFCLDLLEPAKVLAGVLQRFFDVVPVCCKAGGLRLDETGGLGRNEASIREPARPACDPKGLAAVLNDLDTNLNVIVGLCVGVDCLFTAESDAPVTTIFVKDKSLANNPIGAVYSHYYLKDI